jgi:UDP-N-acetylmuramoyl-tripeptide--D-alanyl-D-alanine ligase
VVRISRQSEADVWAGPVTLDELARPQFTLHAGEVAVDVDLAVHGDHHVSNALCAAAVALECGATTAQVAEALAGAGPVSGHRMRVSTRADGVTVIDDAYNANPESVRAGLKALVSLARSRPEGRSWAVLGEMAELGESSAAEHDAIGRLAVRLRVDRVLAVGPGARLIHAGASHEGSGGQESAVVGDADEAIALLQAEVRPGDVVLVKASKVAGLRRVARALVEAAP